jgi:ABC-type amino acid transport substrate-binding protein
MKTSRRSFLPFSLSLVLTLFFACQQQPQADTRSSETHPAAAVPASVLAKVRAQHKIVAGWAPYAPYASKDIATGKVKGYYIDLFNRAAEEGGVQVEWVETTWSTMIADLHANKFEVMAAPVFRTVPRAIEVGFTKSIDYFGNSAVVRAGDVRFKNIADFNDPNVTIAVTQGEVGYDYAKRYLPKAKLVVHNSGDISLALIDVIQKRADAGICDAWTAREFAKQHAGAITDLFGNRPFNVVGAGWFVEPAQTEWLNFLNTEIDWLQSSGEADRIAGQYSLPSVAKPKS